MAFEARPVVLAVRLSRRARHARGAAVHNWSASASRTVTATRGRESLVSSVNSNFQRKTIAETYAVNVNDSGLSILGEQANVRRQDPRSPPVSSIEHIDPVTAKDPRSAWPDAHRGIGWEASGCLQQRVHTGASLASGSSGGGRGDSTAAFRTAKVLCSYLETQNGADDASHAAK